jgi:signal transduction histidine kinase
MKRYAIVFVLVVLLPSVVLGWLALDSLRNQELVFERQQELLLQGVADRFAERVRDFFTDQLNDFSSRVDQVAEDPDKTTFDERIRAAWPRAAVGFVVTLGGKLLSPSAKGDATAKEFLGENRQFLTNAESAEIYQQPQTRSTSESGKKAQEAPAGEKIEASGTAKAPAYPAPQAQESNAAPTTGSRRSSKAQKESVQPLAKSESNTERPSPSAPSIITRSVNPEKELKQSSTSISNVLPAAAEFNQLIGDAMSGAIARFVGNDLTVIFWHRRTADPETIFGVKLNLNQYADDLRQLINPDVELAQTVCIALVDDEGKPVTKTIPEFTTNWKHPFVATEVGEILPHWEIAVYLLNPALMNQTATTARWAIGLLIGILLLAISIGSWLIWRDIERQIRLARQKTDFVSNVSHELKTPLTSIRMFSELLASNPDEARQKRYSEIIAHEAARLTRLINNVLDFTQMDRREMKYDQQIFDLNDLVVATVTNFRPHFESNGIALSLNANPIFVRGNRDAIAQVLLNLLSNAEKYGAGEIEITTEQTDQGLVHVHDRGPGVPQGSEKKIFEQFYRAHDSLSNGIQGAGLGLTLARQIARTHGGDVIYQPRREGGSRFSIHLPLQTPDNFGTG